MDLSRRDLMAGAIGAPILAHCTKALAINPLRMRCINVVNFIRAVEPRGPMDLFLPVQKQMELVKKYKLPATWLLQYDSLCMGPFVPFLKKEMEPNHEAGLWFEMNQKHCEAAGVEWRGRPGYEWDWQPSVAFSIGYTVEERHKLVDEAVRKFTELFGKPPRSVASWNLDSRTIERFVEHGVHTFAVCRDQIATDGFTIWGGPIAGYHPSKNNAWSPAVSRANQIDAVVLRMLGQDPVYYYDNGVGFPDTMEPAWETGRDRHFIDAFFKMLLGPQCMDFGYVQLGQENSFGWPAMAEGFTMQMELLSAIRDKKLAEVQTMGETGRLFRNTFQVTPQQGQSQLVDPLHKDGSEKSIWYQNRFYRANLHIRGTHAYLRDLTVYRDGFPQPFLDSATRDHELDQRQPSALDGFHWRGDKGGLAGGFFLIDGKEPPLTDAPVSLNVDGYLWAGLPIKQGSIGIGFPERALEIKTLANNLTLEFRWDPTKSAFTGLTGKQANFKYQNFNYSISVQQGKPRQTDSGWLIEAQNGRIRLGLG